MAVERRGAGATRWVPIVVLAGLAISAAGGAIAGDPRSTVVLLEDCANAHDRVEITLFANGTVRLREGQPGRERLSLLELGHAELGTLREVIRGVDWEEVRVDGEGPDGNSTVRCALSAEGRDLDLHTIRYQPLDSGSLELNRLRQIATRLIDESRAKAQSGEIPASYRPRFGDRLERKDGVVFEIVDETTDGGAIELVGVDQPYSIYIDKTEIRQLFQRVLSRLEEP